MSSSFEFQEELNASRSAARSPRSRPSESQPPAQPMTVSQLTAQIERVLRSGFPNSVTVKGEVSNFKHHGASGHAYFTLKDRDACINCVMFKSDFGRVKFTAEDGMELLATGRIAVYPQRGSYQLYVSRLEPLGRGALELAFRQLCERLQGEGLFAAERKTPLPPFPRRIALVTSRATAALQDMLKVLRRFAWLDLMLYHVPVQGEQAAGQIASALDDLARRSADLGGIDLILLGRGGGSLEDLWAFNEEIVARAVAVSPIPIITGVGHEVDVTIADLVADYHAHTPTEAAQVATRRWRSVTEDLETMDSRLRSDARDALKNARQSLDSVLRHEFFRRPTDRINHLRQRIDDLESRTQKHLHQQLTGRQQHLHALALRLVEQSPRHLLARNHQRLAGVELRLLQQHPRQMIRLKAHELTTGASRLNMAIRSVMNTTQNRITQIERHLNAIGPRQVLARGYSITTLKKGGIIVRTTQQVKPGQRLVTRLADGEFESVAEDPNQPTLFE